LANGIGNLVARTTKMAENSNSSYELRITSYKLEDLEKKIELLMEDYRIDETLMLFREEVSKLDREIQEKKPWENLEENKEFLETILNKTLYLIDLFSWVLPTTKGRVWKELSITEKGEYTGKIKVVTGLFPRIV
jgi:methionyl-tRNA synthetase